MTITETEMLASCDRDGVRLDTYIPSKRFLTVDIEFGGQSQNRGTGADNDEPINLVPNTAFSSPANQTATSLIEMNGSATGTGADQIGPAANAFGFADYLWKEYGYKTKATMTAWQGMRLSKQTPSSSPYHHEVTDADAANSLVRGTFSQGVIQNRSLMVPRAATLVRLRPNLKIAHKVYCIAHGEAVSTHLLSGVVTQAEYTATYQRLWDWKKANEGYTLCGVHEHGRTGTNELEIAANEPRNLLVRAAQAAFVNANDDVIWASQAAKDTTSLIVDTKGTWVSGFGYDPDGIHWNRTSQNAIGRLFARLVAEYFNL